MRTISIIAGSVLVLALGTSLYTVKESERGIVLRLGKIQVDDKNVATIVGPGLHAKIPFADSIRHFDTRLQTLEIQSSRMLTEEKKDVIVDLFVKWRIKDLSLFFTRTGGIKARAERLLQEQVVDGIRAEFGRRTIQEVVSGERQVVMDRVRRDTARSAENLGIEVIDTRIKRIDFPAEVSEKVFVRMRTERMRVATEHRAQGRSKAEMVRAQADARASVLVARAENESRRLKGEGEAAAAGIYAQAFAQDPDFYRFQRFLQAYRHSFDQGGDSIVLTPDSPFFEFWNKNPNVK
ncbi:MAG: protease modulator HflC [Pseudomonadota bacterium]